jgi:hypothetical protein
MLKDQLHYLKSFFLNFAKMGIEFHTWNLEILGIQLQFQFVTFFEDGKFKRLSNKPLHARF